MSGREPRSDRLAHLDDLSTALDALTRTSEQADAAGFIERNDAIDELELRLVELTHTLDHDDVAKHRPADVARVVALRDRFRRINDAMAQRLRERIAAAAISPGELLTTLRQYVGAATRRGARDDLEYDDLDALVAGILSTDQFVDEGRVESDPEMVPYQPTPARLILALLPELRPTQRDVFVDLGSGLGTVPTLVSLLGGARAVGIERHPDYCAFAQRVVGCLNLRSVSFVQQDARAADFSTGSIFYMFTPFKGTMLRDVLRRLENEGRRRAIRLCTYGPLLREALRRSSSFSRAGAHGADVISVFRSTGVE